MASPLLGTSLVAAVRRNGMLGPETPSAFPTDDDIVAWLNEELPNCLVPMLMKPREERFVTIEDFTTVANVAEYDIPAGATWEDLRDVQVLVPGSSPEVWVSLRPTPPEQAYWGYCWFAAPNQPWPAGYYLQANQIVIVPPPPTAYAARIKYFRRPDAVAITGYSTASGVVLSMGTYTATVASTTGMTTGYFNVLAPTTYAVLAESLPGTVVGSTVTFAASGLTADQIAVLVSGNVLVNTGSSPIAQIPQDLAPLLTARATYRAMQAKRAPEWKDALMAAEALEKKIFAAMTPRADGLPQTVVVTNAPGMGNGGGYGYGWGGGTFGGP